MRSGVPPPGCLPGFLRGCHPRPPPGPAFHYSVLCPQAACSTGPSSIPQARTFSICRLSRLRRNVSIRIAFICYPVYVCPRAHVDGSRVGWVEPGLLTTGRIPCDQCDCSRCKNGVLQQELSPQTEHRESGYRRSKCENRKSTCKQQERQQCDVAHPDASNEQNPSNNLQRLEHIHELT